nr:putative reverse transcriptase domain-containing protein [Tanacetum cinerariifolium]
MYSDSSFEIESKRESRFLLTSSLPRHLSLPRNLEIISGLQQLVMELQLLMKLPMESAKIVVERFLKFVVGNFNVSKEHTTPSVQQLASPVSDHLMTAISEIHNDSHLLQQPSENGIQDQEGQADRTPMVEIEDDNMQLKDLPALGLNVPNLSQWEALEHAILDGTGQRRILPLKDLGMNKYLPIKKEVVIDGKKMLAKGADASQGQCDDNAVDWLPAPTARVSATKIQEINLVIRSVRLPTPPRTFPSEFLLPMDLDRSPAFKALYLPSSFQLLPVSPLWQPIEWQLDRAENLNEELEHLDMTSETNESVDASFVDDQSSEHIWKLRSLSELTVACVTAGKVYNVTEWAKIHPGGDIPLMNLAGQDVTGAFIAFHPGSAWQHYNKLFTGYHLKDYQVSKVSKDYRKLASEFAKAGMRISCTAPPKSDPKPSALAPPSPPLAALFTFELSQPSSSRPKEGMAAVFQEIEEAITITKRLMDLVIKHNCVQGTNNHKRKFEDKRIFTNNNTKITATTKTATMITTNNRINEDLSYITQALALSSVILATRWATRPRTAETKVRQVEIQIDLILGATPVARAPYKLAPSEMQELSDQLQELADTEEHKNHLRIILELLKKEKLYAKFSKCDFWNNIVQFLVHVIDSQGIHVDHTKIEAVKDWASPTTPTEVRQFLGLVGYYQIFIKDFSKIAKSLTILTQKNKKYIWGEKQKSAVQLLKQRLCKAPILALPEGNNDFVVYCNASIQDALSRKERIKPFKVRALVMALHPKFPSQNLEAQTEAIKEENIKAKNL